MNIAQMVLVAGFLLFPTGVFAAFSDVHSSNPYATAINALQSQQIIGGYDDGTFRPTQTINRAELLKILVHADGENPEATQYHDCFPDVHGEWFAPSVCYAHDQGWVQGYGDGTFHPENVLTEAEALKMIVVSLQNAGNGDGCDHIFWYSVYLCEAKQSGILGSTTFAAAAPMTRGMAAEWMYNAMNGTSNQSSSSSFVSSQQESSSSAVMSADSSSIPAVDLGSMNATLKRMQSFDTQPFYAVFGADDADLQRLDEIPNEYAKIIQSITLGDPRIATLSTNADALSAEFDSIVKRLQCALENDCSLQN